MQSNFTEEEINFAEAMLQPIPSSKIIDVGTATNIWKLPY